MLRGGGGISKNKICTTRSWQKKKLHLDLLAKKNFPHKFTNKKNISTLTSKQKKKIQPRYARHNSSIICMFWAKIFFNQHGLAKKKCAPQYLWQKKNIHQHGLAKKKLHYQCVAKKKIPPEQILQHLMVHPLGS